VCKKTFLLFIFPRKVTDNYWKLKKKVLFSQFQHFILCFIGGEDRYFFRNHKKSPKKFAVSKLIR